MSGMIFTQHRVLTIAIGAALLAGCAHVQPPAAFTTYGSFRHMNHSGDTSASVRLADLDRRRGNWGMGALEGLNGEVLLYDGQVLVTRGSDAEGAVSPPQPGEGAIFFGVAHSARWRTVPIPHDMTKAEFQNFVEQSASANGVNLDAGFAFRVSGPFSELSWHVVNGRQSPDHPNGPTASGHANGLSHMRVFGPLETQGELIGLYAGADREGIISHPGNRFHVHYIDAAHRHSGHVDDIAIRAGADLMLPVAR